MSENTTPQMGSPEKEPLLKSEGTDQTSAEELLDQISENADDFPTVESILQEFGINTAEASGTQNEDAGTENMPEMTSDTEEQEHAEPQETETPPGIEPDKAESVTETDKDSVSPDQAEQESEQSEEKENTPVSPPESTAEHEAVPSEKASEEKPPETKDEEMQPEAAAEKQTAEKEPPQEEKSPQNSEDDSGSQAEDEGNEQEGAEDAENASAEPESPPGAEAPDEEESGVDKAVDKLKHLWKIEKKPRKNKEKKEAKKVNITTDHKVLVKGLPASPGLVAGKVHVITNPKDIEEFKKGEILVTQMTSPDWVPAMKKAVAIVTDAGGMTCHASIVSRELGIPCVVGTKSRSVEATLTLKNGQDVTVDAQNGIVYEGVVEDMVKKDEPKAAGQTVVAAEYFPPTGTGIMMNLGDPDLAEKYASLPCDGIGLMREEFIWTTFIHEHPLYLIETGRADKVIDMLAEGVAKVCRAMSPRPVVLRFSDFKSGEYRNLKGGDKYEPVEPADLLGWRGASRYYDPKYTEAFRLELKAVRKVREEFGLKNLNCMIPFCRTVKEAELVTGIMREEGLVRGPDFKLFLMAEIPANIILADQFNQFVDGYSIGSNDLTMLLLGCDRNNDTVSALFDERNLAVKRAIRHLIATAHKDGKTVSICGQAPSVYPEFTEFLIKSGIDYVSVNPDMVKATKRNAARIEQRLMLDAATGRGIKEVEDYTW